VSHGTHRALHRFEHVHIIIDEHDAYHQTATLQPHPWPPIAVTSITAW
jgi:hypothetical protein